MRHFPQRFVVLFTILIFLANGSAGTPSDLYLCVDRDCKGWISQGKTLLKYNATTAKHLSFNANEDVSIVGKPVNNDQPDWMGKIKNQIGLVPKNMVREVKMSQIPLDFINSFQDIPILSSQEELDEKTPPEKTIVPEGDFSDAEELDVEAETIGEELYLWARGVFIREVKYLGKKLHEFVSDSLWDTLVHMQQWVHLTMFAFACLFAYFIHRLTTLEHLEEENIKLRREIQTASLLAIQFAKDAEAEYQLLKDERNAAHLLVRETITKQGHDQHQEIQRLKTEKEDIEKDRADLRTKLEVLTHKLDKLLPNISEPELSTFPD